MELCDKYNLMALPIVRVGSILTVRRDLLDYERSYIKPSMLKFLGQRVKVREINIPPVTSSNTVLFRIEGSIWSWRIFLFEEDIKKVLLSDGTVREI